MANTTISALPSATTPLAGTEVVPIVQSGVTKKVAVSSLGGGTGSVTSVSVASNSNGITGSVTNPTTTPSITLGTSVSGLVKGSGGAFTAATAGTDYQAPITLTTTGSAGAATFASNTLNIPTSPITTTGDIIIGNGTNSATRLPIGANTYVLTSNGTTAIWAASTGGGSPNLDGGIPSSTYLAVSPISGGTP